MNNINNSNGKGSKSRVSDRQAFNKHYDEINWNSDEFTHCYECGMVYKTAEKETRMQFIDGDWVCWKCNWN